MTSPLNNQDIVSPCGMCRELITDYSSNAWVIIPGTPESERVTIASLLPNEYCK